MARLWKRYQLWFFYAVFLFVTILFGSRESFIATESAYVPGKLLVLVIFICFLAFSIYATTQENFFRSIRAINDLLWGRQVGLNLYISVFLSLALIYLIEGSALVVILWLVPILVFANLAILPYILLKYGEIVGHFLP